MRRQIVTGKQNYPHIMIELELKISFVQSMSVEDFNSDWFFFFSYLYLVSSVCFLLYGDDSFLTHCIFKGMKIRGGLQGVRNQNHLLVCKKRKVLHIGKSLWKEVGIVMQLCLRILLRKGRRKSNHQMQFLLQELVFLLPPKGLSM